MVFTSETRVKTLIYISIKEVISETNVITNDFPLLHSKNIRKKANAVINFQIVLMFGKEISL